LNYQTFRVSETLKVLQRIFLNPRGQLEQHAETEQISSMTAGKEFFAQVRKAAPWWFFILLFVGDAISELH